MFGMRNRGLMPQSIEDEFEHLFARLRAILSQTFDPDGNLIVSDPNLAVVPIGAVMPFAGASAPTGFLLCDGSQVSRLTYKGLFDVIGTTYGTGDGSTTFHLPDLRQRFPLGKSASGTGNVLGATGGAIDHTHDAGSHTHSFSATSSSNGGFSGNTGSNGGQTTSSNGSHTHTYSDTTSGPSADVSIDGNEQNSLVASNSHTHEVSGTTSSDGAHTHTVNDHSHSISVGDHTHTVSGTTGSAGGTTDAANPPFIALNYIIFTGIA